MLNRKYEIGFNTFSLMHIITLLVVLLSILILYLFRNIFKKSRIADLIFRYTIVALMLILEISFLIWSYIEKGGWNNDHIPFALCSVVMWITTVALIFDLSKLIKITLPWAIIGTILATVVVDMGGEYVFPHFRYIHFFGLHTLFLLGNLYYFFTRKIETVVYKDVLTSSFILGGFGVAMVIVNLITGSNHLFLRELPSAVSFLHKFIPAPWHGIILTVLMFGLIHLCYLPFYVRNKRMLKEISIDRVA